MILHPSLPYCHSPIITTPTNLQSTTVDYPRPKIVATLPILPLPPPLPFCLSIRPIRSPSIHPRRRRQIKKIIISRNKPSTMRVTFNNLTSSSTDVRRRLLLLLLLTAPIGGCRLGEMTAAILYMSITPPPLPTHKLNIIIREFQGVENQTIKAPLSRVENRKQQHHRTSAVKEIRTQHQSNNTSANIELAWEARPPFSPTSSSSSGRQPLSGAFFFLRYV